MKKQLLFACLLAVCSATVALVACNDTPSEKKEAAKDDMQDAKEKAAEAKNDMKDASQDAMAAMRAERDSVAMAMDKTARDLDAEISKIDNKIDKASAKEKARWQERRNDKTGTAFDWDLFVLAGDPAYDSRVTIKGDKYGSPDGLYFDADGRLWIQTDISNSSQNLASKGYDGIGNNMMLAADPRTAECGIAGRG